MNEFLNKDIEKIIDNIKRDIDYFFFYKLNSNQLKKLILDFNEVDKKMLQTLKGKELEAYIYGKLIGYHQILLVLEKKKLEFFEFIKSVGDLDEE
jgi:hypothetical protein